MYEITQAYPNLSVYYGLLSGLAFSLSQSFFGVIGGKAIDKYNRIKIISIACIGWSLCTYLTGAVNSLAVLAGMRFLLGVTQSVADPCLFSLVADFFPGDKIAKANGILMGGAYIGAGLSALNVILINAFGWRGCLKTIGLFGFSIAAAALVFVREPVRDQFKKFERQQREIQSGIKEKEEV